MNLKYVKAAGEETVDLEREKQNLLTSINRRRFTGKKRCIS